MVLSLRVAHHHQFTTPKGVEFSRTAVDNWLQGSSSPSIESLDAIAKGLGQKPWELIRPDEDSPLPDVTFTAREALTALEKFVEETRVIREEYLNYALGRDLYKNLGADEEKAKQLAGLCYNDWLKATDE